jgi:hypothetical protein
MDIKSQFPTVTKIQEVITLLMTTQEIEENKNRSYQMKGSSNMAINTTDNKDLLKKTRLKFSFSTIFIFNTCNEVNCS